MRKLLVIASLGFTTGFWSGQAVAFGEAPWPAYRPDAPYWPDYRSSPGALGADCVRWNWQEHSYYNYCGNSRHFVRPLTSVVRVRG